MSAKHTPGPWYISIYTGEIEGAYETGKVVCDPSIGNRGGQARRLLPIDEREANARLIAAAPELLEALQGFEALVRCVASPQRAKALAAQADKARAAIAKATGAQS